MQRVMLAAAVMALMPVAGLAARAEIGTIAGAPREVPRESWAPQDPADSLYREARSALTDGDYRRAVQLFREIRERHEDSAYAPDAYYWEAFALYRLGGSADQRRAIDLLEVQRERYPQAATRDEASVLATRIRGELARGGDSEAAIAVTERATVATESCLDEDADVRVAALNALLQMDAERAMPILEKVLARRDECSATLRRKAVFIVSQADRADAADVLFEVARSDPDSEVREQAVFWISQVDDDRAVAMLDSILRSASDRSIKEKALFALSQHESGGGAQVLRDFAQREDAPAELREKAIFWIGQTDTRESAEFLKRLYGQLQDAELREKVLFSIAQDDDHGNQRWLMDVALDADGPIDLRKKALFWAGQSGVAIDELIELYSGMQEVEMREQLIFVYSQRDDDAAVDKLMDIARTEEDVELRKKALFWLSQSDDPRVGAFLLEIIDQ
ncbi:MAG: HEAT repeat domain-containing protein [Gemmatimonadaceae bacterium]